MTVRGARAITYLVVAALVICALRLTPPLEHKPAELLSVARPVPTWKLQFDTLGKGENLRKVLVRGGLTDSLAASALAAATSLTRSSIRVGLPVTVRGRGADSVPSEVVIKLTEDRFLHLQRDSTGWTETTEALEWTTDTLVVTGTIRSNLYRAMDSAAGDILPKGARDRLVFAMADSIYQFKVDMARDLQPGDIFRVETERSSLKSGVVHIGKVIAASLKLSGRVLTGVRFASSADSESGRGEYFDEKGNSMRGAFLHAPVQFRYISSGFGMRLHPILGIMRMHKGTDYVAPAGTPVQAIGNGVVTSAGWSDGYGNLIEIRHPNGYVTRYGHLSRFAPGIHSGTHVTVGEVIGHVGMTGLATAPHLHFELLVNGDQRNPLHALKATEGEPIPAVDRVAFNQVRDRALVRLLASGDTAAVAQR